MTAVIGIINKSAAAIAADSAVTVNGPQGPKIFNNANKIFQLSKKHPVGLMIYNNGEFLGTPWEVIIKQYRKQLDDTSFPKLSEYKDDFIRYLHEKGFFADQDQQKRMFQWMLLDFMGSIYNEVLAENSQQLQQQPNDALMILGTALNSQVDLALRYYGASTDFSPEMLDFTELEFSQYGMLEFNFAFDHTFNPQTIQLDFLALKLKFEKLTYLILKSKRYFNFYSGLVFTGYGEEEYFPSIAAVNISIAINNRLRYFEDEVGSISVSHNVQSAIRPFAQKDVIDTILTGIDPRLSDLYFLQFRQLLTKYNEAIAREVEQTDHSLAQVIRKLDFRQLSTELENEIYRARREEYIDPLKGAVVTLSKEDLAEMAESLIYLTYLKRRFTFAEESVGGPVDVAIITKGEGFIWIKRKHYFKKELNPYYFKNT